MRVGVAGDHAGFALKALAADHIRALGHDVTDFGALTLDPLDDYPDYAFALAAGIRAGSVERGVLICGSGVGASVAANKVVGIRAAVCHDTFSAHQGVEDDDMNVLCLGSRVIGPELARELIAAFLRARFSGAERHRRRLAKVHEFERQYLAAQEVPHG
jgi:RpiB/LacA/LacB family sugar-phosphate isomerase